MKKNIIKISLMKIIRLLVSIIYIPSSLIFKKKLIVFIEAETTPIYKNIDCIKSKISLKKYCVSIQDNINSIKNLFIIAKAKIIILDQSSKIISTLNISPETTIIQVWHSSGLYKKVGFDAFRNNHDIHEEFLRVRRIHGQIDYFIISDAKLISSYAQAFKLSKDRVLPLGLARTDLLYQNNTSRLKHTFLRKHPECVGKKIVLFAPTFRAKLNKRYFSNSLDIQKLKYNLGKEYCFALKLHPSLVNKKTIEDGWIDFSNYDYEESILIPDILITDYSSILFDFSLTKKTIFLYLNDIDEYQKTQRNLYLSPEELVSPQFVVYTQDELILKLRQHDYDSQDIAERFMEACDGNSSQRIARFIENLWRQE